jgi:hypothetical protein
LSVEPFVISQQSIAGTMVSQIAEENVGGTREGVDSDRGLLFE